jgi:hypothetical protein
MRKVSNNENLKKFGKNQNYEKICLELCEVFTNASSHKMRPHCILNILCFVRLNASAKYTEITTK